MERRPSNPEIMHRSSTSDIIKRQRHRERVDVTRINATNDYIMSLEDIIQKKNTQIISLNSKIEQFKPLTDFQQKSDPTQCADAVIELVLSLLDNKTSEIKEKILKKWTCALQTKQFIQTPRSVFKSFTLSPRKPKFQYVDVNEEVPKVVVKPHNEIMMPCYHKKAKPNDKLFDCLVDEFCSGQSENYENFQILTKLFISPLRTLALAHLEIKTLDIVIPFVMRVERNISRYLLLKEEDMWDKIKTVFQEMAENVSLISGFENSEIHSAISEACTDANFKKEQESKINEQKSSSETQIYPVTFYLESPLIWFKEKRLKMLEDLLDALSPSHAMYQSLKECYLVYTDLLKKYDEIMKEKASEKTLLKVSELVKDQEVFKKSRKLLHFGALKVVEEKEDWCMGFLFSDLFLLAKPSVPKEYTKEKESLLRFENVPCGTDVEVLNKYSFDEITQFDLTQFDVKKIVDNITLINAFMIQAKNFKRHCGCVNSRESQEWTSALIHIKHII
ncbi:hypothetical protein EIN_064700 [Entamoeba invadens IP1]|uniref:DH domain-containing protein n=1 Tax=Entamoeba invadens IP1 TaxID=370355 RepID=A0A0A1TXI8_ENTIV|nr:hypothetical protein EIN_064700 [Entamoeba invadens IP1]ELP84235.1 hypothetical protein EIN_064700 [Entamoeba invadens IP1]|eukprot:XP_004183581.1 hypothetical protein EIN_064700 [Entamoeba invadens IP1]